MLTIAGLAESALDKMWGWFRCIGTWTSGLIGIYCIIGFVKILIEILINAIAIQREHGWSLKILASFWDTLRVQTLAIFAQRANSTSCPLSVGIPFLYTCSMAMFLDQTKPIHGTTVHRTFQPVQPK